MNVKAIQMSDLLKQCDDVYTTAMIVAKRSKQIIDDRVTHIEEEVEEVEDSILFSEPEINEDNLDKPMVVALNEYLNGDLEWRYIDNENSESDDS
tara:strand:+ start:1853 stop:2137 length:285 start_codon:yes stop_codon:yes gene_type:complete